MIYKTRLRWQSRVDINGLTISRHIYQASCSVCDSMRSVNNLYKVKGHHNIMNKIYYICNWCAATQEDADEIYVTVVSLELL